MEQSHHYCAEWEMPKIGIRPVVDGRRDERYDALCRQAMEMAQTAKRLYETKLLHPNGRKVECVIADRCIDGVAQSAACNRKFSQNNVGVVLTVTPCWCYGTEVMYMERTHPQAIWGLNATERPGAVFLAAAISAHNQLGIPAFAIYGKDVQEKDDTIVPEDVEEKLLRFARAGLAVATMRGKSYLGIGTTSMGIAGSMGHEKELLKYFGIQRESIDMCEIDRRITRGIYDQEEFRRAMVWTKEHCPEGDDNNPSSLVMSREEKDAVWETVVKMTIIIRDLMIGNPKLAEMGFAEEAGGHNAIAGGFQGQRQWTDYKPNGDFSESILCSSFDWNGIREAFVVATEDDSLNGMTMLLMHLVSGIAQGFADVRTYWSPEAVERVSGYKLEGLAENGFIHLLNSGAAALDATGRQRLDGKPAMKHFTQITPEEADACLKATRWSPALRGTFYGGGFSSTFLTEGGMPMTMARLSIVDGLGPVLQIAEGWSVELPEETFAIINDRTDPTWPTTLFAPRLTGEAPFQSVYHVMANWGANHGAFCYGHIGADLVTLASMLRIPVTMCNVERDKLYRPAVWGMFGSKDAEAADILACKNWGPLYG